MQMKSFFLILVAGLILSVGNGFRMSLGIYGKCAQTSLDMKTGGQRQLQVI